MDLNSANVGAVLTGSGCSTA